MDLSDLLNETCRDILRTEAVAKPGHACDRFIKEFDAMDKLPIQSGDVLRVHGVDLFRDGERVVPRAWVYNQDGKGFHVYLDETLFESGS